jgi:hypothetical protein
MTCKTVEADSGVFSLGSKSFIPPTVLRGTRLTTSGCSTSHKLVILRFNLHRKIYEHPIPERRRIQYRLSAKCHGI